MGSSRPLEQGDIFLLSVAGPGVGLPQDIVPPGTQVWKVKGLALEFRTDATVANRQVAIVRYDGTNYGAQIVYSVVQTASLNWTYNFLDWITDILPTTLTNVFLPLNSGSLISTAQWLRIYAYGMVAGDEFSNCRVNGERWISD